MKKAFYYLAVLAMAACTFTACSDDDDENSGAGSTEMYVPASIVDGTRVQNVGGLNATYNEDGSIAKLENGGITYNFEYTPEQRAAVSTGRQIKRIYVANGDGSWEATNLKFNADGFLTALNMHSLYKDDYYSEETNLNYTLSYDGGGHLKSNKVSGFIKDTEDGETETDKINVTINYTWNGGNLTSANAAAYGTSVNIAFTYGDEDNTFNIFTPFMAAPVGLMDDPLLGALAMIGFTGNSSAKLPTAMVNTVKDEDGTETESAAFTYTFNSDHSIDVLNFITKDSDGYNNSGSFKYYYFRK